MQTEFLTENKEKWIVYYQRFYKLGATIIFALTIMTVRAAIGMYIYKFSKQNSENCLKNGHLCKFNEISFPIDLYSIKIICALLFL